MKKTKRTLVSMIVFLTIFCLPAIFNIQSSPFKENQGNPSKADAVVSTESDALTKETEDIEVQSFSYDSNSITTFWDDQGLASNETQAYQAGTNNVQENNSLTKEADTSEEIAKEAIAPAANTADTNTSVTTEAAKEATKEDIIKTASDDEKKVKEPIKEDALYANIGISVADSFVNIREEASADSEIVGKLYKDAAAEILDTKDDWYHIESGSVKGYVKSEYIKTGIPDEELIEKYSELHIIVDVDGLNVREKPETESKKLTVVYLNETYPVVELKDDWIKISIADDNVIGYVNNEFADVLIDFKKAISREEEKKLLELQAAERAKKETEVKHQDGVNYSDSDLKLLACLIHSEAGTQSYEGKLAVANIVLNRIKSSKYPDTLKAVIYQPGQFSVAASGSLAKQLANYDNYCSNSQLLSIKAARAALEGANNIGTRLYFHSYKAAVKKGYDEKSTSVKLGDHLFW
ncbi:MAG: hypothetical protein K0S01_3714 [Herbinix sp.]|jgi:uncharacterized protein YgiM (DUF1202 family)|nr:hypothetical protein [Herbinix sp.]